jgi:glycosyltransferase involved in cell wall biosynthesis
MKLSIIIPCYNEAATIATILERVENAALPEGWDREAIVVDDGSSIETKESIAHAVAETSVKASTTVQVLTRTENGGKGRAVKDGIAAATGDYLIIQDADLEYDPADFARLLAPLLAGEASVAFGSRNLLDNNSPGRALYFWGGQLVTFCFNMAFGTHLSDITTCYKLFPREFVPAILAQKSDDFVFDAIELTWVLTRKKVVEVPIRYAARTTEQGKKLRPVHGLDCVERIIELRLGAGLFRVMKFVLVGGLAAVVNLTVLYLFTSVLGVWYLLSSMVSFLVALVTNFFLQKFWAFRSRHKLPFQEFIPFVGANLVNLVLNTGIVYVAVSILHIHYLLAQIIASVLIACESFFIYQVIFKDTRSK